MSDYSEKVCEACQPDADPATKEEINEFLSGNSDWQLTENDAIRKIERTYKFKNFKEFSRVNHWNCIILFTVK